MRYSLRDYEYLCVEHAEIIRRAGNAGRSLTSEERAKMREIESQQNAAADDLSSNPATASEYRILFKRYSGH